MECVPTFSMVCTALGQQGGGVGGVMIPITPLTALVCYSLFTPRSAPCPYSGWHLRSVGDVLRVHVFDKVIPALKENKSPATDGVPDECYMSMRGQLTECFNSASILEGSQRIYDPLRHRWLPQIVSELQTQDEEGSQYGRTNKPRQYRCHPGEPRR